MAHIEIKRLSGDVHVIPVHMEKNVISGGGGQWFPGFVVDMPRDLVPLIYWDADYFQSALGEGGEVCGLVSLEDFERDPGELFESFVWRLVCSEEDILRVYGDEDGGAEDILRLGWPQPMPAFPQYILDARQGKLSL